MLFSHEVKPWGDMCLQLLWKKKTKKHRDDFPLLGELLYRLFCLCLYICIRASLVAQMVKNLPAVLETRVQSLSREDPLRKEMTTHCSVLECRSVSCAVLYASVTYGLHPTSSSIHGFLQARILEIPFSRGSSQPRDWTWVSCIGGRCFTIWATREVPGILGWRSPWTEEPGGLQSLGPQTVGHGWATDPFTHVYHT